MEGRMENAIKINNRTRNLLKEMPDFVNGWFLHMSASDVTEASIYEFINRFRRYLLSINPDIKNLTIEDLTKQATEEYMISIKTKTTKDGNVVTTSDSYKQGIWTALNSFFEYAVEDELIIKNPMKNIKKSKNNDLERINANRILLTSKDFTKIRNVVIKENDIFKERNAAMVILLMTTGIRRTALVEINVDQIDFEKEIVEVVDKGDKYRSCPLSASAIEALQIWMKKREELIEKYKLETDALFISAQGRLTTPALYKIIKKISKQALGKEISPHKLRSGYISVLYNTTHDAEFVRRAVGHSNISTTERYIVPEEDVNEKSKNIMNKVFG